MECERGAGPEGIPEHENGHDGNRSDWHRCRGTGRVEYRFVSGGTANHPAGNFLQHLYRRLMGGRYQLLLLVCKREYLEAGSIEFVVIGKGPLGKCCLLPGPPRDRVLVCTTIQEGQGPHRSESFDSHPCVQ